LQLKENKLKATILKGPISAANIDAVTKFLPDLLALTHSEISKGPSATRDKDGALVLDLHVQYHPVIEKVIEALYQNHLIQAFDWGGWQDQARRYYHHPSLIQKASLETCVRLLTTHVRKDRFCSGHFGDMIRSEHIQKILARLKEIRGKSRDSKHSDAVQS